MVMTRGDATDVCFTVASMRMVVASAIAIGIIESISSAQSTDCNGDGIPDSNQ
ncbi:MAG: hypothetical protein O3B75_06595 [Planctomycetota bacterium]|nr:hypothetical protein [Planctomycetota bacterium]